MHDLLQQMGRDIVRQECIKHPEKRSRLWISQDIYHVLTKDLGRSISVESISLDMSNSRDMELSSTTFERMSRLKFLKFYSPYSHQQELDAACKICNISLSKEFSFLPDELRYLYWYKYPLTCLPLNFCPNNLVQLHLICSHVQQLCKRDQCLENLKVLDLSDSVELIKIPDLSELSKLEVLRLRYCTSLVEIYSSIPYDSNLSHMDLGNCKNLLKISSTIKLKRLNFLSLEGCSGITEFPKVAQGIRHLILNGTSIEQVPSSIRRLTSLARLSLEGCTRLESLPSSIGELKCLERLNLTGCSELASLPNNIGELKCLKRLCLKECSKLMNLPDGIVNLTSLKVLDISMCQLLNGLPENFGNLESLKKLNASESGMKTLPTSINRLSKLVELNCVRCEGLKLPPFTGLSRLEFLFLEYCGLTEIAAGISSLVSLKHLLLNGNNLERLPTTIKQLSQLQGLYLKDCKRLKWLSDLPSALEELDLTDCKSLESVLTLVTKGNLDSLMFLDTRNCESLDPNECRNIADYMLRRFESLLPQLKFYILKGLQGGWVGGYSHVYDFCAGFYVDGGELPQRMRYQNNSGSSLQFSLRPDPCDFMVLTFCAVVAFKDYHSCEYLSLECKCRFTADSGVSLGFLSSTLEIYPTDHVLGSEHTFTWLSAVNLVDSKYSFNKATFEFYLIFMPENRRSVNSSVVVIKCGVHLLCDDKDINLPSFIHRETPSVYSFPCWRDDTIEIKEDEEEEEEEEGEEQVNCGLIKRV